MLHTAAPLSHARSRHRGRRLTLLAVGVVFAAVLSAVVVLLVNGAFAASITAPLVTAGPYEPTSEDGLIRGDEHVTLADEHVPAIARLEPGLRDAMRQAEADAADEGLAFQVMSGWRSAAYQEWLFNDAIEFYADEETARQYVATPERSTHITGEGIDIGPIDAQFWLIEHGSRYGICQTYANERWHFELATEPGGVCPQMKMDATS